jgi:hippurate hydrolase
VAQTYGATALVNYMRRYPVLMNDPTQTAFCLDLVRDWLGESGLVPNPEPVPASEDFAFFLEKVPGCFINIGNGVGSVGGCMVHNAGYDFNDRILSTGATYWVKLVERWLAKV